MLQEINLERHVLKSLQAWVRDFSGVQACHMAQTFSETRQSAAACLNLSALCNCVLAMLSDNVCALAEHSQ